MKRKKEDYFVIIIAAILLVIVFVIAYLAFTANSNTPSSQSDIPVITSAPPPAANTEPPVLYNPKAQDRLLDKLNNRKPISDEDSFAKAKILANLPEAQLSGVVYRSRNIKIDYTQSADQIQVEILTTNINQAKAEANVWFRRQGMSQEGICNLPVSFYLNWDIAEELRGRNIMFSPLPNSC